jgi:FAD/FMN-containing dehydrogenase
LHTLGADTLAKRYPRWQDFNDIRRELDPKGIMLNAHLKKVFGHD